ncbi:DUF4159 domain-containing protein [Nitrospina watsonii]|uniref:DUF4159 domain-containing protein n=1 Tax=Nitrospina watsonii TaxID=1323948 RepID=A0ABN8VVX0_9BACT|nr:DUF4159 domain-containing protein [Nitrospina watsonii]CAI2717828.1 conserved protein of unknown function [Nitrospina watsonii]
MSFLKSFVCWALIIGFGIFFSEAPVRAEGEGSKLIIPQIKYQGGSYRPRPDAVESLLAQVAKRTSIEVKREVLELAPNDPNLFHHPFIYMAGDRAFDPFTDDAINALRDYLNFGGFLLIDDNSGQSNSGFDASVRRMLERVYPHTPLERIPRDHSIFRSFYLINQVVGRVVVKPYLEGITSKGRTVLVYANNDLGGAWSKNKLGHWNFDMVGGGYRQRKLSLRLGVNIVMYAFTLDYKKDMVHLPIILERLRRYSGR